MQCGKKDLSVKMSLKLENILVKLTLLVRLVIINDGKLTPSCLSSCSVHKYTPAHEDFVWSVYAELNVASQSLFSLFFCFRYTNSSRLR